MNSNSEPALGWLRIEGLQALAFVIGSLTVQFDLTVTSSFQPGTASRHRSLGDIRAPRRVMTLLESEKRVLTICYRCARSRAAVPNAASHILRRAIAAALALAVLPAAPPSAAASPVVGACLLMAAAQATACQWRGMITITQIENRTTTTPIGTTGGTLVDETHINDITTIQASGDGGGIATRDYSLVHTITRHELPSVQCAAGQPFTTGTHTVVQDQRESGKAAAPVEVSVSSDSGGTYTIATARPMPDIARTTTYKETWDICKAPKPMNSTQNATQPGSGPLDIGMQGQLDPSTPRLLDGTSTQAPLTFTWHLEGNCGQCEDLQARVKTLTAMLDDDAAMLKSLVDPLQSEAAAIGGEAPELAGVGVDITSQLIAMQVAAQAAKQSGGDPDVAVGVAAADWLGPGAPGGVELVLLLGGLAGSDATPRDMTGVVVGLMQAAQPLAEKVRADRDNLADAQTQLDQCLAAT